MRYIGNSSPDGVMGVDLIYAVSCTPCGSSELIFCKIRCVYNNVPRQLSHLVVRLKCTF